MATKILIEVDLGQRGVEKTDVAVFVDGQLIENRWNCSYDDLPGLAHELKAKYPQANIETWCLGQDCCGRYHRWKIDTLNKPQA